MKYLNKILEINEIDDQIKDKAVSYYLEAKKRAESLPVTFSEDAQMMLSNHLMALIKRILERSLIEPVEEEMMSELSETAWEYARTVAGPIFQAEELPEDRTEIFLVGTHMEMAMAATIAS